MYSVLFFSTLYLLIGFALAAYCWRVYDPDVSRENFSLSSLILWPLHTLGELGLAESEGGFPTLIEDCKELDYKAMITIFWPLKIICITVSFIIFIVFLFFKLLFKSIITVTILLTGLLNSIFDRKSNLKNAVAEKFIEIWTNKWAVNI